MFTRILVPTDFSATSDAALVVARTMAERFGASLQLLHVLEDPFVGALGTELLITETPEIRAAMLDHANDLLARRITPAGRDQSHATGEVVMGHGARTIVEYAGEHGIDLIVMGTHGRGGLTHLLLGSVAERVVRTALCPVLTVRGHEPAKEPAEAAAQPAVAFG